MPSVRDHAHGSAVSKSGDNKLKVGNISAIKNQLLRVTMCQSFDFSLSIIISQH